MHKTHIAFNSDCTVGQQPGTLDMLLSKAIARQVNYLDFKPKGLPSELVQSLEAAVWRALEQCIILKKVHLSISCNTKIQQAVKMETGDEPAMSVCEPCMHHSLDLQTAAAYYMPEAT